ncbi:23S rRNA (uracil(1939)-C(5))-methyltransferase RlmD [Phosphitispora sp. TUW77]|uniref:23S rRNA (uracil(1939)-C(5))-methyltransferase RlmD n=1 Tax=Phosphitispora sp. TUW77 TaxID=3152361 RepID=UPI003AB62AB1
MSRDIVVNSEDEIELYIETVNHQGEGVGRYRGMAVFVPFTIPGEKVLVKINSVKKNFAQGEIVEVISLSEKRIEPRCPVFETCGGSKFQHMDYGLQLELKKQLVEDSLKRIGRITDVEVKPVIGMESPWGYRNKVQFQVNFTDGKIKLGFFEEGTHVLVPTTNCHLLDEQVREIASFVEALLNKFKLSVYNRETEEGLLRYVIIRKGWFTSKVMVVLATSGEKFPEAFVFARELRAKLPVVVSVVRNISQKPTRHVFGRETQLLSGQSTITDHIGKYIFAISPESFFQVNSRQTEILYEKALEYAALTGEETVLDVYCGIGTISLFLAEKARRVIGYEESPQAVSDAGANAKMNNVTNVEFVSGKAENRLPRLAERGFKPDVIVVDPPRQGIDKKALQAIADMEPARIVYISCDPGTMARDLQFLSYRGYRAVEVQPVDMFPQTVHVETVVLLSKVDK